MQTYLEFEKQIADLDGKVRELRTVGEADDAVKIDEEVSKLEAKSHTALADLYKKLDPWQKTQVARHPDRPHFKDYVAAMVEDFQSLAGDRAYADDHAIQTGIGRFRGRSVAIIGHEKGNDTQSRLKHNFGMARPEGYRKSSSVKAVPAALSQSRPPPASTCWNTQSIPSSRRKVPLPSYGATQHGRRKLRPR